MPMPRLASRRPLLAAVALANVLLAGCAAKPEEKPWYLQDDYALYEQLQYWPREEPGEDTGSACVPASLFNDDALGYGADPGDMWARVRAGYGLEGQVDERRVARQLAEVTYSQRHFDHVNQNASPYLHYVVGELEARNMPLELALLPVVESSYNPGATSRSQAAGMWQIVPGTGKRMGLEQNGWYDGRRDVVASTEAALDYLSDLHKRFDGDWYLALAAYNQGEGAVQRAIDRNRRLGKPTDYWSLPLSPQACNYVPKLIALSRVLEKPEDHGIALAPIPDAPAIATVEVDAQVDLRRAAKSAGIDGAELLRLNPALKRGTTVPGETTTLVVPAGQRDELLAAIETLPPIHATGEARYRVRSGDTLKGIALLHQTTPERLRAMNGLKGDAIVAGEYLRLPADAVLPPERFPTTASVDIEKRGVYVVRGGDNLWTIAKRHGLDANRLAKLNGLGPRSVLKPGQHLRVREDAPTLAAGPAGKASGKQPAAADGKQRIAYTVRRGDSLSVIAGRFRVEVAQLMAWNRIDAARPLIKAGQSLVLWVDPAYASGGGAT